MSIFTRLICEQLFCCVTASFSELRTKEGPMADGVEVATVSWAQMGPEMP